MATCRPILTVISALMLAVLGIAPVSAAVEDGQQFKDWRASCPKPEEGQEVRCFIFQNLAVRESNQPVLSVRVGFVPADGTEKPAVLLTVPMGVFLPVGIEVKVDEGEGVRLAYQVCNQGGCVAALPLDEPRLAQFKAGQRANVTFQDGRRQPVTVPVSLSGFTAGFTALR